MKMSLIVEIHQISSSDVGDMEKVCWLKVLTVKRKKTLAFSVFMCPSLLCQLLPSWTLFHQMLYMDVLVSEAGKSPPIRIILWFYINFARVNFKLLQVRVFYVISPKKKQCQEYLWARISEKKNKKFRRHKIILITFFIIIINSWTEGMQQTITGVN